MSARKRARTSEPEPSLGKSTLLTTSWRSIPAELLQQVVTFLLNPFGSVTRTDVRLLYSLSRVCVDWRGMVYCDSVRHVDFWSSFGTLSASQDRFGSKFSMLDDNQQYSDDRVPRILHTLRTLRSVWLYFAISSNNRLFDMAAILHPLQHYTRLTALDITMMEFHRLKRAMQDNVNTALDAIARRAHPLASLALRYSKRSQLPTVDVLRRLCSSVLQLYLPPHALVMMAGQGESVWKMQSVRSFVQRRLMHAEQEHLGSESVVATFDAALPSLTHLHIEAANEADTALLKRIGSRLTSLLCSPASPCHIRAIGVACTALTSLCVHLSTITWATDDISTAFQCVQSCTALTELTVILRDRGVKGVVSTMPLPQLRYLHIDFEADRYAADRAAEQAEQLYIMLTPGITHLLLTLRDWRPVPLSNSINLQRLPLLTHCHIRCKQSHDSRTTGWEKEGARLQQQLGAAWCEERDDVVRWRADRVWMRSIDLPDEPWV